MLSNLHEPNETRLGLSKGAPSGRGWGRVQAKQLYERLSKSKAVISGKLRDLGDFELLIPGIGSDKISDLAINVIRGELTTYTEEQCDLYGVPTENVPAGVFWNPDDQRWESHYANLPVYKDKGLILVPKIAVRRRLVPDYQEFYNYHILRFLEAEHLRAGDALVHTLRNGDPRVYKKDLRAKYKISKEFLFEFSEAHPAELRAYKKSLPNKAATPISDNAIEERQVSARSIDAHVFTRRPQGDTRIVQRHAAGAVSEKDEPRQTMTQSSAAYDCAFVYPSTTPGEFIGKICHSFRSFG